MESNKLTIKTWTTCRVCGSSHLTPLFSFGDQRINDFPDGEKVKRLASLRSCPLDLELCRDCGLVQLRHTAPQELLYSGHYWYKSGTTQTMRDALRDVVECAQREVKLETDDVVLDIGANDGTLLQQWHPLFTRIGVEPAKNMPPPAGIRWIQDFWPCPFDYPKARVVTALGMFYDLDDPNKFVEGVAKVLHPDGVFIAQLMCLRQTLQSLDVGNFCHEHLEYYSLRSLHRLYEQNGLTITKIEQNFVNGGSYRLYARLSSTHPPVDGSVHEFDVREDEMKLDNPSTLIASYDKMLRNAQAVSSFLLQQRRKGATILGYGASTKGNSILQWFGIGPDSVPYILDRDSAKWGLHTLTGIPIVSEEAARQMLPDYFMVLPYAFLDEIVEREANQKWRQRGGKFVVPIPEMRIL